MSTAVNNVFANFQKANARLKEARANTGQGSLGWWPPAGEKTVDLIGLTVEPATFFYKADKKDKKAQERPGYKVTPKMRLTEDPDSPDGKPRTFSGRPIIAPFDTEGLPENQQTRVRIEEERMKGMICVLLSKPEEAVEDTAGDLQAIQAKIDDCTANNKGLYVKVRLDYDTNEKGREVPDREYYLELVSA